MDKCIKNFKTDLTRKFKNLRLTNLWPKTTGKFKQIINVHINDMFQFLKSINECGN